MPNDLSSTPAPTLTLTNAKADKATLEVQILQLVRDYEERYGCRVTTLWLDDRSVAPGQQRTYAVRAVVNL